MNDLSDTDVQSVALNCANCGEPVEIARSALGLFESADKVLCVECLVKVDEYAPRDNLSLEARVALIDDVVEDFLGVCAPCWFVQFGPTLIGAVNSTREPGHKRAIRP